MSNNNNNFEDEIKEEIEVYDDFETDENVLKNIETTYDKFLLESCAFDGKQNEYHNLLKNQMKNIIYEIKEKKQENHKNQINTKKKLFVDFENILNGKNENNNNNFNCDLNKKNYDVTFNKNFNNNNFNNNNNNNNNNDNDKKNVIKEKEYNLDYDNNDKLIESSDSKSYNINIDDFIKDNTMNDDIVNNVGNNSYLLNNNKNINNNNINNNNMMNNNNNNNNEINYNNNNKDNKYNYNNNNNNNNNYNYNNNYYNNNNNNNYNKNFIYTLKDDPQHEKTIQENLNAFKKYNNQNTKKQEKLSDRFNSLYSNPRYSNNNNNHNNSNNNIIYVDDCKNSSERKQQQKHFDEMKQKKLKQLEERIQKNRSRSKPKITNKNNTNLQSENNNNNKIKKRPTTANTKKIIITAQNNKNKIRPSTAKSNNLSTPANNLSNLTNNTTINSNYSHISTRIPVKITREQSKIANKKVKNVKYNKMSNKNSIKKAIAEVCLAGIPNKDYREQILKIIDNCSCENYIILFRNYGRFDLKAVYTYDVEKDYIELLTCINNAPDFLENEQIFKFYKFNVAKNQFSELNGIKNFSVIVDGICIKN